MSRFVAPLLAASVALLGASLGSGATRPRGLAAAPSASSSASPLPKCIHVSKQAIYSGAGYDHVVSIENGCEHPAQCRVTTNVNPEPIDVRVERGQREDVVTFRGSPSSEFTATVSCRLVE